MKQRKRNNQETPGKANPKRPAVAREDRRAPAAEAGPPLAAESDLARLEMHRNGAALLPDPADRNPGVAVLLRWPPPRPDERMCTCPAARKQTCSHLKQLAPLCKELHSRLGSRTPEEDLRSGVWYRLAERLAEDSQETPASVRLESVSLGGGAALRVLDSSGKEMLRYLSRGPDSSRFLERMQGADRASATPSRADLLGMLYRMTQTAEERVLRERGFQSRREALEQSFWYRAAYHGWREFGNGGAVFHPAVEESSGDFTLACGQVQAEPAFRLVVPRPAVRSVLRTLEHFFPHQPGLAVHPVPLRSIFHISLNTELDLEVRPLVELLQAEGEARYLEREELERFRYGDLVYLKDLKILAELEKPGRERRFKSPVRMVLERSQIPGFLEEHGQEIADGRHVLDAGAEHLRIHREYDRVQVSSAALDRDGCWLSVIYGFGDATVSLADLLRARKAGQRYLPVTGGWVDCTAPVFEDLDRLGEERGDGVATRQEQVRLSRMDLLRLRAVTDRPLEGAGDAKRSPWVDRLLGIRPPGKPPPLEGLRSPLRPYQALGAQWLWFLYENGFGGLLCDDMGLGKTHQVMALMLLARQKRRGAGPFLVVCPTTVLSHWRDRIRQHAPALSTHTFHGANREFCPERADVILTSYGVLRNDAASLCEHTFDLVVLDEIQNVKNPETLSYRAAERLRGKVKIGLTGTPVENRLAELKALMDLAAPGYLGPDRAFLERYDRPVNGRPDERAREALRRILSPFTLRRLKTTVLHELPEKIEDVRTCRLSEEQVKLYRDALDTRGRGLAEILRRGEDRLPYLHIFALLNLLKQICNHPALAAGAPESHALHQSGKWDLFKEVLDEALSGGHKVVVYSQYLGMIRIIESHLSELGLDFVTLTGSSRNRGDIISRFNEDPACRAFVGSLKAGGTGIDLVAASVVVHYDRWWNAAREDQATDRVHRIGQTRGVQVLKLVCEGTLEEKISAIIDRKRTLMESIVQEDDPGLLKSFSREELLDLLADPDTSSGS